MQKHYCLGLKILNMLVAEFSQPTPGRTLTQHRKLAVAFRDQSLFSIFELALVAMRQLKDSQVTDNDLREQVSPFLVSAFLMQPYPKVAEQPSELFQEGSPAMSPLDHICWARAGRLPRTAVSVL